MLCPEQDEQGEQPRQEQASTEKPIVALRGTFSSATIAALSLCNSDWDMSSNRAGGLKMPSVRHNCCCNPNQ